jgi:cubilin
MPGNNGTVVSSHNALYLWFRSDSSYATNGFKAKWNVSDPICGGVITGQTHGSIQSPGYPGNYPHSRDCEWTIYAPLGKRIQFHFAALNIESHSNCSFDYVEVSFSDFEFDICIFLSLLTRAPTRSLSHKHLKLN